MKKENKEKKKQKQNTTKIKREVISNFLTLKNFNFFLKLPIGICLLFYDQFFSNFIYNWDISILHLRSIFIIF